MFRKPQYLLDKIMCSMAGLVVVLTAKRKARDGLFSILAGIASISGGFEVRGILND